jgi:hypothetical protein
MVAYFQHSQLEIVSAQSVAFQFLNREEVIYLFIYACEYAISYLVGMSC